ncbi:hypothetical protein NKH04_31145, partial [Mesorhizobium sp. M1365]
MSELPVVKTRRKGKTLTQSMLIPTEKMVADELRAAGPGIPSGEGRLARGRHGSEAALLRSPLRAKL